MGLAAGRITTCAILTCIIAIALTGCATTRDAVSPAPPVMSLSLGDAAALDGNLSVRLVSVDAPAPPQGHVDDAVETTGTWIQFEVVNTSEASASLPSRPVKPTMTDGDGKVLGVAAITAGLKNGGGGWGLSSSVRGRPYLNPGGSMMAWCRVAGLQGAVRPITIRYQPTHGETVTFVVKQ